MSWMEGEWSNNSVEEQGPIRTIGRAANLQKGHVLRAAAILAGDGPHNG
jgi:hypothetical protein